MTWKIKAKGAKQTTEVISDDPKYAIFKADQWRSHGLEVWDRGHKRKQGRRSCAEEGG